ncbi:MAG: hypothetical protein AAB116_02360 [Candidatus Poribacteria bacterium]
MSGSENMIEMERILKELIVSQEKIISDLRNNISEGKYIIYPEKIVERILWYGIHILRMSKNINC